LHAVWQVGWGGNNGSTVTATVLANRFGLDWHTKEGRQRANYYGSITQSSTVLVGNDGPTMVHAPLSALLPMVNPNDIVLDGKLSSYRVFVTALGTERGGLSIFRSSCMFFVQ
jgi:Myo-inositol-1-phosphate synthase